MKDKASYVCDSCGEEIVVPIDLLAGSEQQYVEDCPVGWLMAQQLLPYPGCTPASHLGKKDLAGVF